MERADRLRVSITRTDSPTSLEGGGYGATGVAVIPDMEESTERMGL